MNEITVWDWGGLVMAASTAAKKLDSVPWFRGQSRDWPLVAGVFRLRQGAFESDLTNRFRLRAPSRHVNCPALADVHHWLCLMTHYRLPTRLLDWTQSILVAAFFAVENDCLDDDPGVICALAPGALNRHFGEAPDILQMQRCSVHRLAKAAFGEAKSGDEVLASMPAEIDTRMMLQQSVFTIHGSAKPLEEFEGNEHFLMRFIIPATAKAEMRKVLQICGIDQASLFPDLEHLAAELTAERKRHVKWQELHKARPGETVDIEQPPAEVPKGGDE
jgi:hypothetical protein